MFCLDLHLHIVFDFDVLFKYLVCFFLDVLVLNVSEILKENEVFTSLDLIFEFFLSEFQFDVNLAEVLNRIQDCHDCIHS